MLCSFPLFVWSFGLVGPRKPQWWNGQLRYLRYLFLKLMFTVWVIIGSSSGFHDSLFYQLIFKLLIAHDWSVGLFIGGSCITVCSSIRRKMFGLLSVIYWPQATYFNFQQLVIGGITGGCWSWDIPSNIQFKAHSWRNIFFLWIGNKILKEFLQKCTSSTTFH